MVLNPNDVWCIAVLTLPKCSVCVDLMFENLLCYTFTGTNAASSIESSFSSLAEAKVILALVGRLFVVTAISICIAMLTVTLSIMFG